MEKLKTITLHFTDAAVYPEIRIRHQQDSFDREANTDSLLSDENLADTLQKTCRILPRSFSFFFPTRVKQVIIEVYLGESLTLLPSTSHAVALPFIPSAAIPPDPRFPYGITIEGQGNQVDWSKLPWQPYQAFFEVYTDASAGQDDSIAYCRLTFTPHPAPEARILKCDPVFCVPDQPRLPETTPPISVQFGSQPQVLFSKVVHLHDKLNLFNTGTVGNHRYWRPDHHQQGVAWSPGTVTLKLRASCDNSLLEVCSAPQVTVQTQSVRAFAVPFTVTPPGRVELQVPPEGHIEAFILAPGNYTLLFESDVPISGTHWLDDSPAESPEEFSAEVDMPEESAENNEVADEVKSRSSWGVRPEQPYAQCYRLTFIPEALSEPKIWKRDDVLAKITTLQLDPEIRVIAAADGRTLKRAALRLHPVNTPITEPVTKFGGQPVWLEAPQWPIGRANDKPMEFIGQVALDPQIFGDIPGKMAYIFMSGWEDEEAEKDPESWDPDSGDNAVIIQPGGITHVPTQPLATGPSMERWDAQFGRIPSDCEAQLTFEDEPYREPPSDYDDGPEGEAWDDLNIDKIGGTPCFIQYPEYPFGQPSPLILQMGESDLLSANFGTGQAHVFLSPDGRAAKMLWQC
jgi:hypothetical protein